MVIGSVGVDLEFAASRGTIRVETLTVDSTVLSILVVTIPNDHESTVCPSRKIGVLLVAYDVGIDPERIPLLLRSGAKPLTIDAATAAVLIVTLPDGGEASVGVRRYSGKSLMTRGVGVDPELLSALVAAQSEELTVDSIAVVVLTIALPDHDASCGSGCHVRPVLIVLHLGHRVDVIDDRRIVSREWPCEDAISATVRVAAPRRHIGTVISPRQRRLVLGRRRCVVEQCFAAKRSSVSGIPASINVPTIVLTDRLPGNYELSILQGGNPWKILSIGRESVQLEFTSQKGAICIVKLPIDTVVAAILIV